MHGKAIPESSKMADALDLMISPPPLKRIVKDPIQDISRNKNTSNATCNKKYNKLHNSTSIIPIAKTKEERVNKDLSVSGRDKIHLVLS